MKKIRIIKKTIVFILIFHAFFAITLYFIVPPIAKKIVTQKLSEKLNRKVTIEKIRINPFVFTIEVYNFKVNDVNEGSFFLSFEKLFVDFELKSILRRGLIIKELILISPHVNIVRESDNIFNFSDLIKDKVDDKNVKKGDFKFSVNNIQISKGLIIFVDKPKNTRHEIEEINLTVPFISNLPYHIETPVKPKFSAKVNGREFLLTGTTRPFKKSLETSLNIDIRNFDIPYYLPYLPFKPYFIMESCLLTAGINLRYTQYEDRNPTLIVNGNVEISDVSIKTMNKKPLLKIKSFETILGESDIFGNRFYIKELGIQNPELKIDRDGKGEFNFTSIFKGLGKREQKNKKEKKNELSITMDNIFLKGGSLIFSDYYKNVDFQSRIDNIELNVKHFKSKSNQPFQVLTKMNVNRHGIFSLSGNVSLEPLEANIESDIKNISIKPFQNYLQDRVNILITDGYFNAKGKLNLKYFKDKGPLLNYTGNVSLNNFKTLDSENVQDLIHWKSLYLGKVSLKTLPLDISIDEVSLTDFYSKIVINQEGSINLKKIFVQREDDDVKNSERVDKGEKKSKIKVKVSKIIFQNGHINFTDLNIKPVYSANMAELGGRITGLSSEDNVYADVDIRGKFENYAPLEITGKINPLHEDLFIDLKIDFKDMDLSPLTPYSGKYLGYKIEKGKLFLALKYLIEKKKLGAQNKIFLDQFDLGDKVDSPSAIKLPVRLAIALLKNRKGEIDLDIPVSGYIDDPEFSIWRIVLKVIVNLLEKAATAPFALLGSMFGGGEELSYVEFDYGISHLSENNMKKLDLLGKALYERPFLKLDIRGYVDMEKDREALKNMIFENKIKAQKLKELVKKGQQITNVKEIKIEENEYLKYLKNAYGDEKFPKPKTALGFEKELPKEEMEKLILTNIVVKDDDLRLLAQERAKVVKEYILKSQKVEQERLFLIETGTLEPDKKDNLKSSRVEFTLK